MPFDQALRAPTTGRHDYLEEYTGDIDQVIDVEAIRARRSRSALILWAARA